MTTENAYAPQPVLTWFDGDRPETCADCGVHHAVRLGRWHHLRLERGPGGDEVFDVVFCSMSCLRSWLAREVMAR